MLKSILGVIVGYVVMAIFSFAFFTCAYLGLGVERVFEPESFDISTIWMVLMVVVRPYRRNCRRLGLRRH